MAWVIAHADVKANQAPIQGNLARGTQGRVLGTDFFDFPDAPHGPHATLYEFDPGRVSHPHFHPVDQFQVFISGKCKLGRHELAAYGVHFSRAYTPYGPFIADPETGLTCFVMHAHTEPDWRSRHSSEDRQALKKMPNRHPWQITYPVNFPAPAKVATDGDVLLTAVPGAKDDRGLAGYTLSMKPNAIARAPDPSHGDGQYLIVVKGSLLHERKEYRSLALVFVTPTEAPFQLHAGAGGLEAIVLNFPRPQTRATGAVAASPTMGSLTAYQCLLCAFVYDEAAGLPAEGKAPGTRWPDVPEIWTCPDCGASKTDFAMIEPAHF